MTVPVDIASPIDPPIGARSVGDIVDIDLGTGRAFSDGVPHDAFDRLRAAGGIAWHDEAPIDPGFGDDSVLSFVPSPGFWVATSHALVTEVLRDQRVFSSRLGGAFLPSLSPDSLVMFRQMMLNMDPPEHSRLRRILQPIFTPRAVQRLHDSVSRNASEVVDDLVGAGGGDLVTTVSAELPLRVLADLLGMPREDRHLIFEWSNALIGFDNPGADQHASEAIGAIGDLLAYGQAIADDRRATPRDDIVSLIVHAEVDGERLDDTEFAMFWLLLVIAGNETTRNALSGSVLALCEHGLWEPLSRDVELDRDLLPTAVDELLRFVSPVIHFRRTATVDTVLGDQHVRAGDKVVVWYGSANRDAVVFDDPHELDLARDPNPHLAFGVGPHFCLGAHLARLELSEALRLLLERAPGLGLDGAPSRVASNFINGISALPVTL